MSVNSHETEAAIRLVMDGNRCFPPEPQNIPGTDLCLEREIFSRVGDLYCLAGKEGEESVLRGLARQAELASQILTLNSPEELTKTPFGEVILALKERYQQTLFELLGIALAPYREVVGANGKKSGRPVCSFGELTGALKDLRDFGALITLVESRKMTFENEDLRAINQVFGGKGQEIFWSVFTDDCLESAQTIGEFQDEVSPSLPKGLRIIVWNKRVADFGLTLSNPMLTVAKRNIPEGEKGRKLLTDFSHLAKRIFRFGVIFDNDLGCDRGSWGLAVLATDTERNSTRFLFGFCSENNGEVIGRAKISKLETLTERMREKFSVHPNMAGIKLKVGERDTFLARLKQYLGV